MSRNPSPADLLAVVQRSPDAVKIHDRDGWVALYSSDAEVNDPVGSEPHTGRLAIGRFYDTFIGPNTITFRVDHDVVCGMSVVRDLTVVTKMSTGAVLEVPMHLRYDVVEEGGALAIHRLYAHWELPSMVGQLAKSGRKGVLASSRLAPQLLGNQGARGAVGFMKGFRRVGQTAKNSCVAFVDAARRGDVAGARALLMPGAVVELPFGTAKSIEEVGAALRDARVHKLIAAGHVVSASIDLGSRHGVALFAFGDRGNKIERVQIFL
ncbi:nuclear transport factor 2 family protein [Antrihabitans cavernicola]|uniref:Transporter n=1 Tax=Antrihabitans cavernicola TaxID=2495913 RepID=A0A5A7SC60_9NOCA|nr:nuclear transport factor 2 family protein [Spelaeibacter cavernicola]KAA0023486.1 transporter [Spelaeibacter cavernicola]